MVERPGKQGPGEGHLQGTRLPGHRKGAQNLVAEVAKPKPKLNLERVKVTDLKLDVRNPRTHDERNVEAIRGSFQEFGQVEPLVVNRNNMQIVAGHGRVAALQQMGEEFVDVIMLDVDEQRAAALGVVLNRTAELADWDREILASVLTGLKDLDFDLTVTGFDVDDLDALVADWDKPKEDLDAVDNYDEAKETFTIKIEGVSAAHKDQLVELIEDALRQTFHEYDVKAF